MSQYILDMHPTGLFVRRGIPADPYVIGEVPSYQAFQVGPGDRVLDLGANIGAMSHRFLTDGADYVVAVEPFPDNVEMIRRNLSSFDRDRYVVLEAAVAGRDSDKTLTLHTPTSNFGMISRVRHDVPYAEITGEIQAFTVKFHELVEQYEPTAIKCDIEGGEYDFWMDLVELPDTVTRLAIEWHNFEEHLEDQMMYDAYSFANTRLTHEGGFRLISHSGAMIPTQHSALMCVYARG